MLKISTKASVLLSTVLCYLFLAIILVGAFYIPAIAGLVARIHFQFPNITLPFWDAQAWICILAYVILALCLVIDVFLFLMLRTIRKGNVFTASCVTYIRMISWFCIIISFVFLLCGLYFPLCFAIAFAAFFIGICIRVVKNAIEEAVHLKEENDMTI